ncbi:MAG: hypothetical protein M3R03_00270 [Pseudomonadota bacterium]|nr:hypothetical protein [Pseudomonadota bacterium]
MRSIILPLAALALGACATVPLVAVPATAVRGDGLAGLGETTRVGKLVVTPRILVEDSRCPINARCVWAGRAIVRADVTGPGWRETLDLTLGHRLGTHGTTLTLTSVEPGKMAGVQTSPQRPMLFGFEGGG